MYTLRQNGTQNESRHTRPNVRVNLVPNSPDQINQPPSIQKSSHRVDASFLILMKKKRSQVSELRWGLTPASAYMNPSHRFPFSRRKITGGSQGTVIRFRLYGNSRSHFFRLISWELSHMVTQELGGDSSIESCHVLKVRTGFGGHSAVSITFICIPYFLPMHWLTFLNFPSVNTACSRVGR